MQEDPLPRRWGLWGIYGEWGTTTAQNVHLTNHHGITSLRLVSGDEGFDGGGEAISRVSNFLVDSIVEFCGSSFSLTNAYCQDLTYYIMFRHFTNSHNVSKLYKLFVDNISRGGNYMRKIFWNDGGRPWVSFLRSGRAASERMADITASISDCRYWLPKNSMWNCRHQWLQVLTTKEFNVKGRQTSL